MRRDDTSISARSMIWAASLIGVAFAKVIQQFDQAHAHAAGHDGDEGDDRSVGESRQGG